MNLHRERMKYITTVIVNEKSPNRTFLSYGALDGT